MRKARAKVNSAPAPGTADPVCKQCGSSALKRKLATYPVPLTGVLAGRRLDIYRVELDQCRQCGFLMPTAEGKAKIKRCTRVGKEIFLKSLLPKP